MLQLLFCGEKFAYAAHYTDYLDIVIYSFLALITISFPKNAIVFCCVMLMPVSELFYIIAAVHWSLLASITDSLDVKTGLWLGTGIYCCKAQIITV